MPDAMQPQQPPESSEPDGMAEATLFTTPDDQSAGATVSLPAKYAADVFPMWVIAAVVVPPTVALSVAGATMPWLAVLAIAVLIPALVVGVYAAHRFVWAPSKD